MANGLILLPVLLSWVNPGTLKADEDKQQKEQTSAARSPELKGVEMVSGS